MSVNWGRHQYKYREPVPEPEKLELKLAIVVWIFTCAFFWGVVIWRLSQWW